MKDTGRIDTELIDDLSLTKKRFRILKQAESKLRRFASVYTLAILIMSAITLFASALPVGICSASPSEAQVRVGSELDFPPYAFIDEKGLPAGFSVELIKAVADAMGLPITISTSTWDNVWNSLVTGKIDVLPIVAKVPGREGLVDFSLPHTETFDAFFVRTGESSIPNITTARGKAIVVMRSDAAHHELLDCKFSGNLIPVNTIPEGLSLVSSGKYDAFLCSKLIGTIVINKKKINGLTAGPAIPDYKRVFSFAVKKGDAELLEKLNQGLLIVKTNGEYERIYDKWLTFDDPLHKVKKYILPAMITLIALAMIAGLLAVMLQRLVNKRTRELAEKNKLLHHAYDDLETRIQERTSELSQLNQSLKSEITECNIIEDNLRETNEYLENLFNYANAPIIVWNPDYRITRFNNAFENLTGKKSEDVIGKPLDILFPTEHVKRSLDLIKETTGGERWETVEIDIINSDGSIRTVLWNSATIYDRDGKMPIAAIAQGQDITARKQAEIEIKTIQDRLVMAQEIAHIGSWEYNLETGEIWGSEEAVRIYGLPQDTKGFPIDQIEACIPEREMVHQALVDLIEHEKIYDLVFAINPVNSSKQKFISSVARLIRNERGKALKVVGVIQDITESKRMEEERLKMERLLLHTQKLESLGVLAGGIAHDFNNILMAVLGNLELALNEISPVSSARRLIENAQKASWRAADLTRQMLAYSGKGRFVVEHLNLSELVNENIHIFRSSIPRTSVLNLYLNPDISHIMADTSQIQQVVMNLITNAAEAIGEDAGAITLTTGMQSCDESCLHLSHIEEKPSPGDFVYLEVSDTGCGMDEDTLQKLFDPFFTTKFMGRGLGMSALQGIIRGHKGAIFIDTSIGRGTTIRVLFPVSETVKKTKAPDISKEKPPSIPDSQLLTGIILIVDDEEALRDICRQMVAHIGFQTMTAADGQEAVEIFRGHAEEITCIILDMTMPKMDGYATFHALKEIRPDVKVILSSGYNEQVLTQRFTGLGLAGFIQKPYHFQQLWEKLKLIINE